MKILKIKKNKGFVILFSILVSSTILLISSGIFSVVQKEVVLSSYARESQRAFYAADSALECALYGDRKGFPVETGRRTPFPVPSGTSSQSSFSCGGVSITSDSLGRGGSGYQYQFAFRYRNDTVNDESCAYVLVEKELTNDITDGVETRITAVGFNVCTDDQGGYTGDINTPSFNDPTLLERRLSLTYTQ